MLLGKNENVKENEMKKKRNENMATCSIRSDYLKLFFQIIVFRINIDMR